jgi:diguanylate cyclase (GGDEF)-like protein
MENLRIYDITFRYGGEEFLVCLPDTSLAEAEALLNRLRVDLSVHPIRISEDHTITINASFGIAALNGGELVTDVVERADHALLCAKSRGRNRVCVWDI